jgi:hypothetical protein
MTPPIILTDLSEIRKTIRDNIFDAKVDDQVELDKI